MAPNDVIHLGWAHKQGQSRKSWKRRFFLIESGELRYFEKERTAHIKSSSGAKGVMDLGDAAHLLPEGACSCTWPDFKPHNGGFGVQVGSRTLFMFCATEAETARWKAILEFVFDHKPVPVELINPKRKNAKTLRLDTAVFRGKSHNELTTLSKRLTLRNDALNEEVQSLQDAFANTRLENNALRDHIDACHRLLIEHGLPIPENELGYTSATVGPDGKLLLGTTAITTSASCASMHSVDLSDDEEDREFRAYDAKLKARRMTGGLDKKGSTGSKATSSSSSSSQGPTETSDARPAGPKVSASLEQQFGFTDEEQEQIEAQYLQEEAAAIVIQRWYRAVAMVRRFHTVKSLAHTRSRKRTMTAATVGNAQDGKLNVTHGEMRRETRRPTSSITVASAVSTRRYTSSMRPMRSLTASKKAGYVTSTTTTQPQLQSPEKRVPASSAPTSTVDTPPPPFLPSKSDATTTTTGPSESAMSPSSVAESTASEASKRVASSPEGPATLEDRDAGVVTLKQKNSTKTTFAARKSPASPSKADTAEKPDSTVASKKASVASISSNSEAVDGSETKLPGSLVHNASRHVALHAPAPESGVRDLRIAIYYFNKKPEKGINRLIDMGLVTESPKDIMKFLCEEPGISRASVGEFLGAPTDVAKVCLEAYAASFDFTDSEIDEALRLFLLAFRIPGEAQKIERVLTAFAGQYHKDNPTLFCHEDTAIVLSFSVLMLHTDLHNPSNPRKMTLPQFIRNNRGIDDGHDINKDLLTNVYHRIQRMEFQCCVDHTVKVDELFALMVGKVPLSLVSETRQYVRTAHVDELYRHKGKKQQGVKRVATLLLFNDMLVLCKHHKPGTKYVVRHTVSLFQAEVQQDAAFTSVFVVLVEGIPVIRFRLQDEHDTSFLALVTEYIEQCRGIDDIKKRGDAARSKGSANIVDHGTGDATQEASSC